VEAAFKWKGCDRSPGSASVVSPLVYRFASVMLTSGISVPGERIRFDCRSLRVVNVKFAIEPGDDILDEERAVARIEQLSETE
jgi:hypothetical protein